MDNNDNKDNNDIKLEIIKLYYDEWKDRYTRFWSGFTMYSIISYSIILIPFIPSIIGREEIEDIPYFIFPLLGILFSLITFFINISESANLKRIHYTNRRLIKSLDPTFERNDWKNIGYGVKDEPVKIRFTYIAKIPQTYKLALLNLIMEVIIAVLVTIFLVNW